VITTCEYNINGEETIACSKADLEVSKSVLPIEVFYCYSHTDETLRNELEKHLALLQRQGIIKGWHFRKITGGKEWKGEIDKNLERAGIILLLISSDFMNSDYCYDIEMKRAIELHKAGKTRTIPVILRAVDWTNAPFAKLQALPTDAKPVTSWTNRDEAFSDIALGIRQVCEELQKGERKSVGLPSQDSFISGETDRNLDRVVFCHRCGVQAGDKSSCTGMYTYHDFKSYSGSVYCGRCGIRAGKRTTCTGMHTYHDFESYSGPVYCSRCGVRAGERTICTGIYIYHDFKSY